MLKNMKTSEEHLTKENLKSLAIELAKAAGYEDIEQELQTQKKRYLGEYGFLNLLSKMLMHAEDETIAPFYLYYEEAFSSVCTTIPREIKVSNFQPVYDKVSKLKDFYERIQPIRVLADAEIDLLKTQFSELFTHEEIEKPEYYYDAIKNAYEYVYHKRLMNIFEVKGEFRNFDISEAKLNTKLFIVEKPSVMYSIVSKVLGETDTPRITIFFVLEDIKDYSYFVICYEYKNTVWLVSDQTNFNNPNNKYHRRNYSRTREDNYSTYWPYGLIGGLDKIRENDKTPAKFGSDLFYGVDIVEFDHECKVFMLYTVYLASKRICSNETFAKLASASETILALPSHEPLVVKESFSMNTIHVQNYIQEIREFAELLNSVEPQSMLPAILPRDLVRLDEKITEWVGSEKSINNYINWTVANSEAENIKNLFSKHYSKYVPDRRMLDRPGYEKMEKLLLTTTENRDKWLEFLFSAKAIYGVFVANSDFYFSSMSGSGRYTKQCIAVIPSKKKYDDHTICCICGERSGKWEASYAPLLPEHLKVVLGEDYVLPLLFTSFRAHDTCFPYVGNSILDNISPLVDIKTPASHFLPIKLDGDVIHFDLCGHCANKLEKKYKIAEHLEIRTDMVTRETKVVYKNADGTVVKEIDYGTRLKFDLEKYKKLYSKNVQDEQ